MAPLPERVFDPARLVYVRRPFVAAGRHLDVGTEFKWRQWAIDVRRVRQLFDNGKLTHRDTPQAPDLAGLQARESAATVPLTPEPTVEQETQDDDLHHLAVTAVASDDQPAPAEQVTDEQTATEQVADDLDGLNLKQLREIADQLGIPNRVSRQAQMDDIRAFRRANPAG